MLIYVQEILVHYSLFHSLVGVISAGQIQTTQAYATGQTFGQLQVSRIPVQLEYDQAHTFSHVTLLT